MVFKRFRVMATLRVLLLAGSLFVFYYLLENSHLYFTIGILGLVVVMQLVSLVRFVETTNRSLSRFLRSIQYSDFTQSFSASLKGTAFEELNDAFTQVIEEFQKARMEKEEHYRYLQTIVRHIGVGLIAFDGNGDVDLINNAAKRQLKIPGLHNISVLDGFRLPLKEVLEKIEPGGREVLRLRDGEKLQHLVIYATGFILHHQHYRLVSLQNIQGELEEKEMEAWQKLIRVLTHEIMNSITPISSLSSTAKNLLQDNWDELQDTNAKEALSDVTIAVQTIENRSRGLLNFVQSYRSLTHIPPPDFRITRCEDLFDRVCNLMRPQFEEAGIHCSLSIEPESMEMAIDPNLIEQVIINMAKNALEAVQDVENPLITLSGRISSNGRPVVEIADNGQGIDEDVVEQIFIPFFTTKADGSGIGLAFSKQVMRLHGGSISVTSKRDHSTTFTMRF